MKLTLILENIGNETVAFHFGYMDHFHYVVYDENGSTVYDFEEDVVWPLVIAPPSYWPSGLAFGGFVETWYEKYNYPPGTQTPPGTYHLVGRFWSGSLGLIIETPSVTITLS